VALTRQNDVKNRNMTKNQLRQFGYLAPLSFTEIISIKEDAFYSEDEDELLESLTQALNSQLSNAEYVFDYTIGDGFITYHDFDLRRESRLRLKDYDVCNGMVVWVEFAQSVWFNH
jgi:hypothetical protein